MNMASTIERISVHGVNDVRRDTVPMPVPGPGDIVVKVAVCGICGSDLGYAKAGGLPVGNDGPLPLGHEFAAARMRNTSAKASVTSAKYEPRSP